MTWTQRDEHTWVADVPYVGNAYLLLCKRLNVAMKPFEWSVFEEGKNISSRIAPADERRNECGTTIVGPRLD